MESSFPSLFMDDNPDCDLDWLPEPSATLDPFMHNIKTSSVFPFLPSDTLINFDINSNIPSPGSDESPNVENQLFAFSNPPYSSLIVPSSYHINSPSTKSVQKYQAIEDSPEHSDDDSDTKMNKRKRREIKNKSETKRRNKFNEQLAALRSLLCGDLQEGKTTTTKITRDHLMSSAIEEITKLRQELKQMNNLMSQPTTETDTAFQRMGTGKFPKEILTQQALSDPLNRYPYSIQDLERAFQVMYTRELDRFFCFSGKRTEQMVIGTIRMLEDVTSQIQKQEYSLYVSVLEQVFYSSVKFIPKELKRCLEKNWTAYQALKRTDRESLILLAHGEIGIWILSDMAMYEYMVGNAQESDRIYKMARELCRKFSHRETSNLMLANLPFCWNLQRGRLPLHTAHKIMAALQNDSLFAPMATFILGQVLIANGQPDEGIKTIETGVCQLVERWGDSADICMAPLLLEAYIHTKNVDKGIYTINYVLKKCTDMNIEGFLGKAELLRLKAKLLLMKKYPDFQPEVQINPGQMVVAETVVNEILEYPVASPQDKFHNITSMHYNNETTRYRSTIYINYPNRSPAIRPNLDTIPTNSDVSVTNEEVEILLRSALNLSHTRGMYMIEVRCAIDLARFFMLCGDRNQVLEATQILKDSCGMLKKAEGTPEYQAAMFVLSQLEEFA